MNFIEGMKSRYTEGLTCSGTNYAPEISGISAEELLSIRAKNDLIFINSKPYLYKTVSNDAELIYPDVTIGDYNITFRNPTPNSTSTGGGRPVLVQARENGKSIGQFTYHEISFIIINDSVYLQEFNIGDLVFLFMYYKPDCNSNARLWLVLIPGSGT